MEAQKILFHSLREITANIMTTYERLVGNDQSSQIKAPLIQQQMPFNQLTFFINQAQAKKYKVILQTKQHQRITGKIIHISKDRVILTSHDHRQNALLPFNSLRSIQRDFS